MGLDMGTWANEPLLRTKNRQIFAEPRVTSEVRRHSYPLWHNLVKHSC